MPVSVPERQAAVRIEFSANFLVRVFCLFGLSPEPELYLTGHFGGRSIWREIQGNAFAGIRWRIVANWWLPTGNRNHDRVNCKARRTKLRYSSARWVDNKDRLLQPSASSSSCLAVAAVPEVRRVGPGGPDGRNINNAETWRRMGRRSHGAATHRGRRPKSQARPDPPDAGTPERHWHGEAGRGGAGRGAEQVKGEVTREEEGRPHESMKAQVWKTNVKPVRQQRLSRGGGGGGVRQTDASSRHGRHRLAQALGGP